MSFLLALQFLTIIPIRIKQINNRAFIFSMAWFPLIGLIIGLLLVSIEYTFRFFNFPAFTIDVITIISLIIITGGMHLDGLSDTFDALLSHKPKEEMLRIMRDSHAGVMGILAIIIVILLKISFLYALNFSLKPLALILMCTLSRWSIVLSIYSFPYARTEGKAKAYIEGVNLKILSLATATAVIITYFTFKINGSIILLLTGFVVFLLGRSLCRKIKGITGDTLGATNEIIEVIVLFIICIFERSFPWII